MGLGTSKILPILLEKTELHPKLEELEYLDFTVRYGEEWDKLESILRVSKEQFDIFSKVPHAIQMATFSLKSWNPFERCAAIKVFGEQKYVVAWETIVDFLDDPSWEVREETVETLKIFADKRTVSHLADAARKDEDWRVRSHAIEALVQIDAESVVPTLVDALKDENNHIRNDAIEALIKIDIETAIPHIRSLLKDSNQRVKRGAIDALRNLGTPEALAALAELGL
jgi:HEAT repeat protein